MFSEYQVGEDTLQAGFESGAGDQVRDLRNSHVTRLWSYDEDDAGARRRIFRHRYTA